MKIKKHVVGLLMVNCYVVWDEASREALVIDPGASVRKIARTVAEKSLKLKSIVQTHHHWDHSAAAPRLSRLTGAPILRHPADLRSGILHRPLPADGAKIIDLDPGRELTLGASSLAVIHTPGHSAGSICLYGDHVLFSGDLLFKGGIGRFDLKGASFRELMISLNDRIAHLPDDTDVLPGHGPATSLGSERRSNPFMEMARTLARSGYAENEIKRRLSG